MLESILTAGMILVLGGAIYKQFTGRLNRLEDKVDWLIIQNGGQSKPKSRNSKGGQDNDGPKT